MNDALAPDVLEGAEAIAEYLYGDASRKRSVYNFARNKQLPVFWLGANMMARKSRLRAWIEEQENAAVRHSSPEAA